MGALSVKRQFDMLKNRVFPIAIAPVIGFGA